MLGYIIKGRKEVAERIPSEVGMITVKKTIDMYMIIHGTDYGMWTTELDGDCILLKNSVLDNIVYDAGRSLDNGDIDTFMVVEYEMKIIDGKEVKIYDKYNKPNE